MSEPRWFEWGVLPTEPGYYLSLRSTISDGHCSWKLPCSSLPDRDMPTRRFYGPIPDPPKAPPKLMRFRAIYKREWVSGVYIPEEALSLKYMVFPRGGDSFGEQWCREDMLSEIKFLDD